MLKAVLFDFDGTIFDIENVHIEAVRKVFEDYSKEVVDVDELRALAGIPYFDRLLQMLASRGIDDDELVDQLEKKARKLADKNFDLTGALVPGVADYIKMLSEANVALAVVSSALQPRIIAGLKEVGLDKYFQLIIGRDNVKIRKPHPEPYVLAMEKLGVRPENAIAFEDSPPGLESAWLAGLKVVALLTTYSQDDLAKADKAVHDFTELTLDDIKDLL